MSPAKAIKGGGSGAFGGVFVEGFLGQKSTSGTRFQTLLHAKRFLACLQLAFLSSSACPTVGQDLLAFFLLSCITSCTIKQSTYCQCEYKDRSFEAKHCPSFRRKLLPITHVLAAISVCRVTFMTLMLLSKLCGFVGGRRPLAIHAPRCRNQNADKNSI